MVQDVFIHDFWQPRVNREFQILNSSLRPGIIPQALEDRRCYVAQPHGHRANCSEHCGTLSKARLAKKVPKMQDGKEGGTVVCGGGGGGGGESEVGMWYVDAQSG